MKLTVEPITLHLRVPFRIAHGTSTARHNVLVRIGDGTGEAALPPYYPYSQADVTAYLAGIDADALLGDDPFALERMLARIPAGPPPARAALDAALHDDWAKRLGHPLYRLWGLDPRDAPASSLTLGIPENDDDLRARIEDARGFPLLKLKLGAGDLARDEQIVRVAREATGVPLCVDANSAWSVDEAARIIPRLAAYDLRFVEQPLDTAAPEAWHALRRRLPAGVPPLFADESVRVATDVPPLAGAIDGINIKLAKAGGLAEARRMIALARTLGLQVMLGCMIESTVGITAAAHLAPLVDYADLDGNLYVANDPYTGATVDPAGIHLPDRPGLGLRAAPPADVR